MATAVLLAAGSGERFSGEISKQMAPLAGSTVLEYSLNAFEENQEIKEIVLVTSESLLPDVKKLVGQNYKKIKQSNSHGISSKIKIILQIILAIIGVSFFVYFVDYQDMTNLYFPFFKNLIINLGWFFIPFSVFVIIGSSNAVNLTDGLDGLATVPVILVAACFAFISYVTGNVVFSDYLQIPYIEGTGEVSIFCGAIIGSCLGFLWFNAPPAKIFMGDTGSLSLGGSLGAVGIITKHEIVLAITGGLFVLEAVSVGLPVIAFDCEGMKEVIHHEKNGYIVDYVLEHKNYHFNDSVGIYVQDDQVILFKRFLGTKFNVSVNLIHCLVSLLCHGIYVFNFFTDFQVIEKP